MVDNITAQLEGLGVTVTDTGSNTAPNGDASYEVNYVDEGLSGTARMVVLGVGDGQIILFTIDQSAS